MSSRKQSSQEDNIMSTAVAEKILLGKTLAIDADGNLVNISDWNEEIAAELAKEEGIEILTEKHWQVINYMRKVYSETGDSPSIRKLTKESGVDTKELYALFPKGPAKKAARIAGLPKPKGCI
ncbi:MAG: DsrC family protein [Chlorobi bacterium OLB5]|nr:MAG: DsrC family protein [Chlorobi bacterium OLB5]